MKIKWININELEKTYRLAVHKSGKLGFSNEFATAVKMNQDMSVTIGLNDEDPSDTALYMMFNPGVTPGAFKIAKAGHYFYLNIKLLLKNLKIDYKAGNVVYEADRVADGEVSYYKLTRIANVGVPETENDAELDEDDGPEG